MKNGIGFNLLNVSFKQSAYSENGVLNASQYILYLKYGPENKTRENLNKYFK